MIAILRVLCGSSVINHRKSFGSWGAELWTSRLPLFCSSVANTRRGDRVAFRVGTRPSVRDSAPPKRLKSIQNNEQQQDLATISSKKTIAFTYRHQKKREEEKKERLEGEKYTTARYTTFTTTLIPANVPALMTFHQGRKYWSLHKHSELLTAPLESRRMHQYLKKGCDTFMYTSSHFWKKKKVRLLHNPSNRAADPDIKQQV